jgi:4-hydroxybenzoate polyprenyltransferase/phosphoserine phosphatase
MSLNIPLVVDLDGTLINTDMLHESCITLFKNSPISFLKASLAVTQGKAALKRNIASLIEFSPDKLPYNQALIDFIHTQKLLGRKIILCTASDQGLANAIAKHLNIFDEVLASDGKMNLSGSQKADQLLSQFGKGNFDYAGNSKVDLEVWKNCRKAIVVNASDATLREAKNISNVDEIIPPVKASLKTWMKLIRVHQWLKNLLLFVPLLAAHLIFDADAWIKLIIAFLSFSLCASTVYLANDLLDLESDRSHPRKKNRPFASGAIPIYKGILLAPFLFIISFFLASLVNHSFMIWLGVYFLITCAYSIGIKKMVLVDCLTLALLYTLRIIAGTVSVELNFSFWLLAFSIFLFLSLAFIKRYAELEVQMNSGNHKIYGRGYLVSDASLIQSLGITAGFAAVIVLSLYINSDTIQLLYPNPEVVWGVVPIMLFWISWMWMQAHRGLMHDDPLIFAVKNKPSLVTGFIFVLIMILGAMRW